MNRTRPNQIVIRVSDEELELIKGKVVKSGISQQEFIIKALLEKPVVNTDGIKEIVPELKRIGNNINQIAKRCNENTVNYETLSTKAELSKISRELNETWQLLKRLARGQA